MTKRAILFDLDGTLLDSIDDLADSTNAVLERHGFPRHPVESYLFFVGDGASTLVERAVPDEVRGDEKAMASLIEEYRTEYASRWNQKSKLYDGIAGMLDLIEAQGDVTMSVLSNKPHRFTEQCVDHFLDRWSFPEVFGQREEVAKKPDPAGAIEIAGRLGVHVGDCLFVGDTSVDIHTGRAAGMKTVGVLWGFRPEEELREAGAHSVIASPADLIDCLIDV